ncbi:hypothetical protein ACOZ4I_14115 [Haloarcula salina]|uniref:hypothetical protein n=1 Tax=Haloarcula salina TaxID=1429914 RepID=UPI003C6EC9E7
MEREHTVDDLTSDSATELRRAARGNERVAVADAPDDSVRLVGEAEGLRELVRTLWVRELSAREFGQPGLAAADRAVRMRLQRQV